MSTESDRAFNEKKNEQYDPLERGIIFTVINSWDYVVKIKNEYSL